MRPRSTKSTVVQWLWVTLSLLAGVFPGSGLSVCVAADGDVALEVSPSGSNCAGCLPSHVDQVAVLLSSQAFMAADGCSCTDVALPASALFQAKRAEPSQWQIPTLATLPPSSASLDALLRRIRVRPERLAAPMICGLLLRSVVLLV